MKKLLGISLEVHGITSFRFFSQDMAEAWCIDLLGNENSPSAELACLFSLTKKTEFDKSKLHLKPYRLNTCLGHFSKHFLALQQIPRYSF